MALNTKKHLLQLIVVILIAAPVAAEGKPKCPTKCGSVDIPYPFGIKKGCYLDDSFFINCTQKINSTTPPIPVLGHQNRTQVLNISVDGELRVLNRVFSRCRHDDPNIMGRLVKFRNFSISPSRNKFVTIGCNLVGQFGSYDHDAENDYFSLSTPGACATSCREPNNMPTNGSCFGNGCSVAYLPQRPSSAFAVGANFLSDSINVTSSVSLLEFTSDYSSSIAHDYPCGFAFIVDEANYSFSTTHLKTFFNNETRVPVVLDWSVTVGNRTCLQARHNRTSYACKANNSVCTNSTTGVGYLCKCSNGFTGNPYLVGGCNATKKSGGNGMTKDRDFPRKNKSREIHNLIIAWRSLYLHFVLRERKLIKMRKIYFQQNGGILLQQQIAKLKGSNERTMIFTEQELKKATNNYDEARVIGKGGHGTVYKGLLPKDRAVAIKKSKISSQNEIEQFINEVVVLSQINHRNVVKLLGCCLETEVPLLVYEFITNGTLSDHIHVKGPTCHFLPWPTRLRIATETAEALSYLHSAASTPIIHRDVKTTNILLDHNLTAKVSDFGASKLVPLDQTQLTTLVQGTLGYLDPEYFQTSQLTEKSDVYSFGVVLAELLTSKKALSFSRLQSERNLSNFFVSSMREGQLPQILDKDIVNDANVEQILEVANLAKRCLVFKGEERPSMKEVAMSLEGLRIMEKGKHSLGTTNVSGEESDEYFIDVANECHTHNMVYVGDSCGVNSGFHSMQNQILDSLGDGR